MVPSGREILTGFGAAIAIQTIVMSFEMITLLRTAAAITTEPMPLVIGAIPSVVQSALLNLTLLAIVGLVVWKLVWLGLQKVSVEPSYPSYIGVGVISTLLLTWVFSPIAGLIWGSMFWLFCHKQQTDIHSNEKEAGA